MLQTPLRRIHIRLTGVKIGCPSCKMRLSSIFYRLSRHDKDKGSISNPWSYRRVSMAEAIVIVGGVASFIQIVATLTRLTKELNHCLNILRYAPKEVEQLQCEMCDFSYSLQWFCELAQKWFQELERSPQKKVRVKHFKGMVKGCRVVVNAFKRLLRKFFINKSQNSSFKVIIDRIRWYFREPQVKGLRLALQSAKSSVTLFMTLLMFEDLTNRIMELERRLQEVPQEWRNRM